VLYTKMEGNPARGHGRLHPTRYRVQGFGSGARWSDVLRFLQRERGAEMWRDGRRNVTCEWHDIIPLLQRV